MVLVWFLLYVLAGMCAAYWIFRDGEFRPIDTAMYIIGSIVLWPVTIPAWLVLRPPSQIKDLTWEKSYAHFKHWQKTHKSREYGELTNLDKHLIKKNGESDNPNDDIMGATSPDNPYVIGKSGKSNAKDFFTEKLPEDDYGWEDSDDRSIRYEIGGDKPRQVYNPFKKNDEAQKKRTEPVDESNQIPRRQPTAKTPKDQMNFDVPSISDILEDTQGRPQRESGKPFRDSNVRKLIDEGRLRDAYRVARRMLKVANELGEEERIQAYQRYLREIENRLKAIQEKADF